MPIVLQATYYAQNSASILWKGLIAYSTAKYVVSMVNRLYICAHYRHATVQLLHTALSGSADISASQCRQTVQSHQHACILSVHTDW